MSDGFSEAGGGGIQYISARPRAAGPIRGEKNTPADQLVMHWVSPLPSTAYTSRRSPVIRGRDQKPTRSP